MKYMDKIRWSTNKTFKIIDLIDQYKNMKKDHGDISDKLNVKNIFDNMNSNEKELK